MTADNAGDFERGLLDNLPALRAYARSLAHDPVLADDLVQETMVRAWEKQYQFEAGTNLKAWLFTIQRNSFYTKLRRGKREVEDPDGAFEMSLTAPPAQLSNLEFQDFLKAFETLSPEHREALVLVGASGFSYQEAAEVCGVAVGTIKSRVNRARETLAAKATAAELAAI